MTLDERIAAAKSLIPELRESEVSCQQVAWSRLDGGNDLNLAANLCSRAADAIDDLHRLALDLAAERERLLAESERMREALEWYADAASYELRHETLPCECCTETYRPVERDDGEIARAALASEPRA